MTKRCYACQTTMTELEAESIADWLDAREDHFQQLCERLDLFNCSGPDDDLFIDGRVVLCAWCAEYACYHCGRPSEPPFTHAPGCQADDDLPRRPARVTTSRPSRPTVWEQNPVYRESMIDSGRGHLLP